MDDALYSHAARRTGMAAAMRIFSASDSALLVIFGDALLKASARPLGASQMCTKESKR